MLFRYYELFFRFTAGGLVSSGALFVASFFPPTQASALLLPFVILYVGFHAAHLFSYVIFARTYAAALERRINAGLGADVLIAHRLEEVYFGAPGDPKLVAASIRRPLTMLAAETWHFTIAGAAFFGVATLIANATVQGIGEPWSTFFIPTVLAWAAVNGIYLAWYFGRNRDQHAIESLLAEAYAPAAVDGP